MKEMTAKEVQQYIENGEKLNIIDVRDVNEVKVGRITGITHIPLGLLEFRTHELDKSKPYIIVCRSGGRSGQATQYLERQGFDVTNMMGGMLSWEGKLE
jgi:rhodanese-related sulfurtransferase